MSGKNKFSLLVAFITVTLISSGATYAAIKDSDIDGISDQAETAVYKTDPTKADTDGDGVSDLIEVKYKSNPLDAKSVPTNISLLDIGKKDPIAWYLARISGIMAFILFTISVSFGLLMTSKFLLRFKLIFPGTAMELHRLINWTGFLMAILHFGSLFFDSYVKLKPLELIVPLMFKRDIISAQGFNISLPVSLGIVAFYLCLTLVVTSELRNKIVNAKVWRAIHYSSFVAYLAFLIHGFLAGSDSKQPWMIAIYTSSLVLVTSLVLARIFLKKLFVAKPIVVTPVEVANIK